MTNCEKKIDALIDALGFDVEAISATRDGRDIPDSIIYYKLTKRESYVPLTAQSKEWGCIVEYILGHAGDIEAGTNDFDTLRPMLDFFNGNCTYASKSKWEGGND